MRRAVVRLPPELLARVDALAARARVAHPDRSFSRAGLVRALVTAMVTIVEQDDERFEEIARRVSRHA
jgi:hypothetical protein